MPKDIYIYIYIIIVLLYLLRSCASTVDLKGKKVVSWSLLLQVVDSDSDSVEVEDGDEDKEVVNPTMYSKVERREGEIEAEEDGSILIVLEACGMVYCSKSWKSLVL